MEFAFTLGPEREIEHIRRAQDLSSGGAAVLSADPIIHKSTDEARESIYSYRVTVVEFTLTARRVASSVLSENTGSRKGLKSISGVQSTGIIWFS